MVAEWHGDADGYLDRLSRGEVEGAELVLEELCSAADVSVRGTDEIADLDEVDAVIDVVGGTEFGDLVDRLRNGGRLAMAGAIAGPVVQFDLRRLYLRRRRLIGSTMCTPDDYAELARIASAGGVDPHVAEVFDLEALAAAQARFAAKDFVGKLVVAPHGVDTANQRQRPSPPMNA